jgi:hypothetical protein
VIGRDFIRVHPYFRIANNLFKHAADIKFRFLFRPRFAMKARAAQSVLYDFYNPDSHVVLTPETFTIGR